MKVFTDAHGHEWSIDIDVNTIRRVRDLAGCDLLDLDTVFKRLGTDTVLLCDVLYAVCQPVAEAKGVTSEAFGAALRGDAIDTATQALLQELACFFPKRRRVLLESILARIEDVEERILAAATARLESGDLEAEIEKALASLKPSTSSPASSESTPAP